jgi:hypothetical protein
LIGLLTIGQYMCNFDHSALTFDLMTLTFDLVDPLRAICGSNYIPVKLGGNRFITLGGVGEQFRQTDAQTLLKL